MADHFQPEQPHSSSKSPRSWGSLVVTALVTALAVLMLLAIGGPRWFGDETSSWIVALVAAGLAFVAVLGVGAALRSRSRARGGDASST